MAYNNKTGWYTLTNLKKFLKPTDQYMQSFNESANAVQYKSSLEYRAFKYCDINPLVKSWSCEPFHIPYIKPTTGKVHRYFIDLYIEFNTGDKFLVEVKHSSETKQPREPKKKTEKSMLNHQRALHTWFVNNAKWEAAEKFCKERGIKFIILTEEVLK